MSDARLQPEIEMWYQYTSASCNVGSTTAVVLGVRCHSRGHVRDMSQHKIRTPESLSSFATNLFTSV